jgi:hypothetical protein
VAAVVFIPPKEETKVEQIPQMTEITTETAKDSAKS